MHRKRKDGSSKKLRPSEFRSEISDIFEKSKTQSNKRAHHSWIGIHQRLKPLPYFLIKWRLKCFWEKSKEHFIIGAQIEHPIRSYCDSERYQWEISPALPDIWKSREKEKNRNQNPLKVSKKISKIDMNQEKCPCNTDSSENSSSSTKQKVSLCTDMHKIRQKVHPEKKRYSDRDEGKNKGHRLFFMLRFFLKDDIVFPDREFFLEDTIDLVPAKYHPRAENQEKKTNNKTKNCWIKKDSNTQYQTKSSEENHRISLYQFSPRYKKNPPFLGDNLIFFLIYERSSLSSRYLEQIIAFSRVLRFVSCLKLYRVARSVLIIRDPKRSFLNRTSILSLDSPSFFVA